MATSPTNETEAALLARVIDFYLNKSREFNGLPFEDDGTNPDSIPAAALVQAGLLQVVSDADWMNPHIRPWASRRDADSQVDSLTSGQRVCLYPTPAALVDVEPNEPTPDEPYTTRIAKGGGALELAYFRFDVLETYRNDPRYDFDFHDFGARCATSNETYQDEDEPAHDKTSFSHLGFAYDSSTVDQTSKAPITRAVCALLCDLREVTPLHQQRWKTYEIVEPSMNMSPHPMWWGQQMGHWVDGLGPFSRFFYELETWNELHTNAHQEPLLKTTQRPREFGWVLRPSRAEFDQFVHLLDKLLSENLRHQAFDELGVDGMDHEGRKIGTLRRLELLLIKLQVKPDVAQGVLKPFRTVRKDRQGPAHKLSENIPDKDFVRRQAMLLHDVNQSLVSLRDFWATHPANRDWTPPAHAETAGYWL